MTLTVPDFHQLMTGNSCPFSIVIAFSDNPFGGNPAAVLLLDTSLSLEELGKYARNLNQPILTVVSPTSLTSEDPAVERRSIRFFTPSGTIEPPVCGHGTLAAAKVIFDLDEVKAARKNIIHFDTSAGKRLEATRLEDGWIEIEIPSTTPGDVDDEEKKRLKGYVDRAFGRDVKIKDIKTGGSVYEPYIMTEIEESEDLAGSVLNANALVGNGYYANVFTSSSSEPGYSFVSRMFAPAILQDGEDHVCGTAHGILTPYWSEKLDLNPGVVVKARQVSKRGGDLRLIWDKERGRLRLRGQCSVFAKGEISLHS